MAAATTMMGRPGFYSGPMISFFLFGPRPYASPCKRRSHCAECWIV